MKFTQLPGFPGEIYMGDVTLDTVRIPCSHWNAEYPAVCQQCHGTGFFEREESNGDLIGEIRSKHLDLIMAVPELLDAIGETIRCIEYANEFLVMKPAVASMLNDLLPTLVSCQRKALGLCGECGQPPHSHFFSCRNHPLYTTQRLMPPVGTIEFRFFESEHPWTPMFLPWVDLNLPKLNWSADGHTKCQRCDQTFDSAPVFLCIGATSYWLCSKNCRDALSAELLGEEKGE